ncbi:MAG: hypothetical protein E7576_14895 [Ruminococcaceae bacterium]|jgi:hypothetical protein|nr:hypothetical protein [Oscillospiraceae bacterium]
MSRTLYSELRTIYETTEADPHTFRITIKLKDLVDGGILRAAVDKTMERYPYFRVRMIADGDEIRFGENPAPVPVLNTHERITLGSGQTEGHLLAFCYSWNRLYIDVFHGLTDGGGIYPLIRTLFFYYLSDLYGKEFSAEGIRLSGDSVAPAEWEDPAERPLPERRRIAVPKWNKPAFQMADVVPLTDDCAVYNLRIPEEEFMRFNISNDGSPATIVALLLARTIDALYPDADRPPVIAICVNQRKALHAPLAHQSLVGDVRLPYQRRMRDLPFSAQATCFRGMVTLQSDEDMVQNEIGDYQDLMFRLAGMKTHGERRKCCVERMETISRSLTATVSYVGKANFGDVEPFIQEFEVLPSTALPSTHVPLTVEMSALHGYFFLNFMQYFKGEDIFMTFIRQLRENGIDYDVLNVAEARWPMMELPF